MSALVLVHGFLGGSAQWDAVRDDLSARQVITPDLPGFGRNNQSRPYHSIADMARYVVEAVLESHGILNFDLLGHSMGGMVAQEIALRYPQRVDRLILYSTGSIGVMPGRFESIATSKMRAQEDGVAATVNRISATWYKELDQSPHHAKCAAIARLASPEAIQAGLDAMEGWDRSGEIHKIMHKTLILWGDADRSYGKAQIDHLLRKIPHAQLCRFQGVSHAVHDEKREGFIAAIKGFLGDAPS